MEKRTLTIKDSSYAFILSFVLGQLALVFFAMVGLLVCKIKGIEQSAFYTFTEKGLGYLISTIVLNFIFVIMFFTFRHKKEDTIAQKINPLKLLIYALVAVVAYFMLYPIIVSFNQLFKIESTVIEFSTADYIYAVFSMVLIPAICEELLFRGLIFKGLANTNKAFAVCISAVMFSIFHMSSEQLLYPLLMGLLFGVIMARENNIIYCIIVHIINNSLALAGVGFYFQHWAYYLVAVVMLITFLTTIILLMRKYFEKFKMEKSEWLTLTITLCIMLAFWIIVAIVK